jgi:hypothetical protein
VTVTERDGRTFDHRARFDQRSLNFRAAPGVTALPATGRIWSHGPVLDQGQEGACVGYGSSGAVAAAPLSRVGVTNSYARNWYRAAQRLDEWPGEAYEGTSVLAGCLEGRRRKMWTGFRWAKRPAELAAGIVADSLGPAIIGVQWSAELYDVPASGLLDAGVRLDPDLGHCVLLFGYVPAWSDCTPALRDQLDGLGLAAAAQKAKAPAFPLLNSWSAAWGDGGRALAPVGLVQRWFDRRGEFGLPEGRTPGGARVAAAGEQTEQAAGEDGRNPAGQASEQPGEREQPARMRAGDETLHVPAAQVRDGDRILDPPDDLRQESVTVRGTPKHVDNWRGHRVVVNSTGGVFQYGAEDPVTVRRSTDA